MPALEQHITRQVLRSFTSGYGVDTAYRDALDLLDRFTTHVETAITDGYYRTHYPLDRIAQGLRLPIDVVREHLERDWLLWASGRALPALTELLLILPPEHASVVQHLCLARQTPWDPFSDWRWGRSVFDSAVPIQLNYHFYYEEATKVQIMWEQGVCLDCGVTAVTPVREVKLG